MTDDRTTTIETIGKICRFHPHSITEKSRKSTAAELGWRMRWGVSHRLIWIFDDEILADPAHLEHCYGLLRAHKRVDYWAYADIAILIRTPDGKVINSGRGLLDRLWPESFLFPHWKGTCLPSGCMLVRKSLLIELVYFIHRFVGLKLRNEACV